jgi:hypothetical protein
VVNDETLRGTERTMAGTNLSNQNTSARQEREKWLSELDRLMTEAQAWSSERGWLTERETKSMEEPGIGAYEAPSLNIRRPDAVLLLEPLARDVVGAQGCVDFSVFPSYERVLLLLSDDGWKFAAPEKKSVRGGWSKRSFYKFADDLAARR